MVVRCPIEMAISSPHQIPRVTSVRDAAARTFGRPWLLSLFFMVGDEKTPRECVRGAADYLFGHPLLLGIWMSNSKTLRECVRGTAAHTFDHPLSLGIWPATTTRLRA